MNDSDKASFEKLLAEGDNITIICQTMVDLVFDPETDFPWLERRCVEIIRAYPNNAVRGLAATCLGHIAQFTGTLSADALKMLRAHKNDPSLEGNAQNALDDWWMFVGRHQ